MSKQDGALRISSEARYIAAGAAGLGLALLLSYVESLIPVLQPLPGVKAGLANVVTVFLLYRTRALYAGIVLALRIALTALLFGTLFSFFFSLAGGVVSFVVMLLLKKTGLFRASGVSISGGVAHNLAQLVIAGFLIGWKEIYSLLPLLLVSGVAAGLVIGLIAVLLLKMIPEKLIRKPD